MSSKLLLGLAILGMLATAAQAQTEPLATAGAENLALLAAPIGVAPSITPEASALDVMCQSAYVDEAIARCIAVQTPAMAPVPVPLAAPQQ
jgi:hypothetical protein